MILLQCHTPEPSSLISSQRFGLPTDMTSDRGAQFSSHLWPRTAKLLSAKLHHTTAYHPHANGLVERIHNCQLYVHALREPTGLTDELPWVLLGIRKEPKDDLEPHPLNSSMTNRSEYPGLSFPHQAQNWTQ